MLFPTTFLYVWYACVHTFHCVSVCMHCVCVCLRVSACVSMCASLCLCVSESVQVSLCLWVRVCVSICLLCVHVYVSVNMDAYIHACRNQKLLSGTFLDGHHFIKAGSLTWSHFSLPSQLACSWGPYTYYFPSFFWFFDTDMWKGLTCFLCCFNVTLLLFNRFHSEEVI